MWALAISLPSKEYIYILKPILKPLSVIVEVVIVYWKSFIRESYVTAGITNQYPINKYAIPYIF